MKRGLIPFALASLLAAQANAFELKSPDISAQGPIAEPRASPCWFTTPTPRPAAPASGTGS